MKKKIKVIQLFIFMFLIISTNACKNEKENVSSDAKTVNIDINKITKVSDLLIDKIEIIPLETNDSSIFSNVKQIRFIDDKYFIIMDQNLVVCIFDSKGSYVSNSRKCFGNGPNEYNTILDAIYNKFTDQFELLGYPNEIICYDKKFNFLKRTKLDAEINRIDRFMPISSIEYMFTPNMFGKTDSIYFYNLKEKKVQGLAYKGNLSLLTMSDLPFSSSSSDNNIYFTPTTLNYSIFSIEVNKRTLSPLYKINIQSDKIDENKLLEFKSDREKRDYLVNNSNCALPLRNLISNQFIISTILKNKELYTNIYNRISGENQIVKNIVNKDKKLPEFFSIRNNILYAIVEAYDVEKYIDRNLLDKKQLISLNNINDESNPLIIKYYLK